MIHETQADLLADTNARLAEINETLKHLQDTLRKVNGALVVVTKFMAGEYTKDGSPPRGIAVDFKEVN